MARENEDRKVVSEDLDWVEITLDSEGQITLYSDTGDRVVNIGLGVDDLEKAIKNLKQKLAEL